MAERMGFVVHRLQAEFPDCEAIRQVGEDKWQKVRIEFEYESRNFLKHMHAASECDLIVCWRNNWPECPLEVVELRKYSALSRQHSANAVLPQICADER
jgi:predicted RNA-binding protein with PUA-like domain